MKYDELDTPCFILHEDELVKSIAGFQRALSNCFSQSIVGYSVKTNSLPYCLQLARECGCFAEVVSKDEFELSLACGFSIDHIIYNGPMKSKSTFLQAIQGGAIVNIETFREIEWLKELPSLKTYEVGIRLNIDITQISSEDQNHDDDNSRFGFSAESHDFCNAVSMIKALGNINITGLHTHRTSKTRSVKFYQNVIKYAQPIIGEFGLNLKYWDFGGGFFGRMPEKPTYENYAAAILGALSPCYQNLVIIVEPGNALVASAFDYLSSVLDVKAHNGQYFITIDGTRNDIDPFFHKVDYFKELISKTKEEITADKPQIVSGSTCLENDRLFRLCVQDRKINVGDKILFHRVGAYTMCLTPLFINYFPCVYSTHNDDSVKIVRERWSAKDFLTKSININK